jgi:hypothetical protein
MPIPVGSGTRRVPVTRTRIAIPKLGRVCGRVHRRDDPLPRQARRAGHIPRHGVVGRLDGQPHELAEDGAARRHPLGRGQGRVGLPQPVHLIVIGRQWWHGELPGAAPPRGLPPHHVLLRLQPCCWWYERHERQCVTLVGHSMGSALAMLLAYDLTESGLTRDRGAPITVFSFGGPRVGNAAFEARCDELGVKALRVANVLDPVTKLPGLFLNEGTPRGIRGD